MMDWWLGLPKGLKYGMALLVLALSAAIFFLADRFWPWGWGVGLVLLFFAGFDSD